MMNIILRQKIIEKLRAYLNREPLENEVINAQNDHLIMGKIRDDEQQKPKTDNDNLKIEVENLKNNEKNVII